jgi:RimJ/RimL family protein N-acetyltransferase
MGISMDLNYTDKGYGTKFISLYLDYVFNNTIFKRIVLRTAGFNKRAIRAYEKVGFNLIGIKECPYEEQIYKKDIISTYKDVVIRGGLVYSDYYFMEILKKDFKKDEF